MSLLPHRAHDHSEVKHEASQPHPQEPPPAGQPTPHPATPQTEDTPGQSPPREDPGSPSRTPAEREGPAPEEKRENPQEEALAKGRDPTGSKFDETGGAPGGSPGRKTDQDPQAHEKDSAMGAAAPEPRGPAPEFKTAQDHKPGEFEQPGRWDAPAQHGDAAP